MIFICLFLSLVTDAKTIKEQAAIKKENVEADTLQMETDQDGVKRVYNKKTLRDQFGNYPVWMNKRNLVKHKKGRGKSLKSTTKPDKRLTRKQLKKKKSSQTLNTSAEAE